jgi:alpha-galactosidase
MILVGNSGLSYAQQKVQLSMWAIFAAPMLMSNDLRTIEPAAAALAQNGDLIAINQDPLGRQGGLVASSGDNSERQVWSRPLANGDVAVALLNLHAGVPSFPRTISVSAAQLNQPGRKMEVYDVWAQQSLGTFSDSFEAAIECTGVGLYRVTFV